MYWNQLDDDQKQQAKELFAAYVAEGFTTLDIEYSGSGDSGDLDEISITNADFEAHDWWNYSTKKELDGEAFELASDVAYAAMEKGNVSGYENNEGGQGHIYVNLVTGAIHIEHETNIITTEEMTVNLELF